MTDAKGRALTVGLAVTIHADPARKSGSLTGTVEELVPKGRTFSRGGGATLGAITHHVASTGQAAALEYCRAAGHPTDGSPIPDSGRLGSDVVIVRLDAAGEAALVAWAAGRPVHPDHALDGSCGQLGTPLPRTCSCPVRAWLAPSLVNL